jgi:hypothetical protein
VEGGVDVGRRWKCNEEDKEWTLFEYVNDEHWFFINEPDLYDVKRAARGVGETLLGALSSWGYLLGENSWPYGAITVMRKRGLFPTKRKVLPGQNPQEEQNK